MAGPVGTDDWFRDSFAVTDIRRAKGLTGQRTQLERPSDIRDYYQQLLDAEDDRH